MIYLNKKINNLKKRFKYFWYLNYNKYYIVKYGLNINEIRTKKIIVTLTSFPPRLPSTYITIKSLLNQTMKPDKIILYLGIDSEYFQIPKKLRKLEKSGLTIKSGYKNIKSHKKYFFAMQEYPDDIIITADDDLIYDKNLIRDLYHTYKQYPTAVTARRVHKMLKKNNCILSYNDWETECKTILSPSMQLFATTGAGTLFPPNSLRNEVFNLDIIEKLCLNADDVWIKFMQLLHNTPVVWTNSKCILPPVIKSSQKITLAQSNVRDKQNDKYINSLMDFYNINLADFISTY